MTIYLASPYSANTGNIEDDYAVRVQRYEATIQACVILLSRGEYAFSPTIHCAPIANQMNMGHGFDVWNQYNYAFIEALPRFMILTLPGWEASVGVTGERLFAESIGRRIEWMGI